MSMESKNRVSQLLKVSTVELTLPPCRGSQLSTFTLERIKTDAPDRAPAGGWRVNYKEDSGGGE
jgi:hypothetical protein